MSDDLEQRLLDGIKVTTDAYTAGEIDALREARRLAEDLVRELQQRIEALESERER
jgi:hypothetical protein